jgi:hypothetical protein
MEDVPHSVEDFGQYYEAMDVTDDEIDIEQVEGENKAEDHLKKLLYHRNQLKLAKCHRDAEVKKAEAEVEKVQEKADVWYAGEDKHWSRRIRWHERCLEAWFKSTGAKTATLIHGQIKNIKGRERVEIIDEDAIPLEYKNPTTTYAPDKKRILALIKLTGEIVEGTEVVRREDRIKIDTPDDAV